MATKENILRRFFHPTMVTLVATLIVGWLIFASFHRYPTSTPEPTLTEEEYVEELILLQQQIIEHKQQLIELYELKRLEEEGKLHSS